MKIIDVILMCLRNLFRRKFRTFLTVSGVVIGTTAIIVMISLGIAISKSQEDMIASYGDLTVIQVWGYDPENQLDDDSLAEIQQIDGVDAVTPFSYFYDADSIAIVGGRKDRYTITYPQMVAVYPDALEKLDYTLLQGDYLPSVNSTKKIQVLMGERAGYQFEDSKKSWQNNRVSPFPDENGVIQDPFLDVTKEPLRLILTSYGTGNDKEKTLEYEIEVVGVLKGDQQKSYETMYGMFISVKDIERIKADYNKMAGNKTSSRRGRRSSSYTGYNNVMIKVKDIDKVSEVEKIIQNMGFTDTYSLESERQQMQESTQRIQMILGGLGAISLFVAAISITNTMIMSVYERTREIGVMKVLGCLVGNIRAIFLLEAGLIGFMGGVLGVALSFFLSFLMNTFSSSLGETLGGLMGGGYYMGDGTAAISIIPGWLVLLGLVFATMIGLVSGFYPANRAVRISALEAIKQE